MKYYADLDKDNICFGICSSDRTSDNPKLIEIPSYDEDYFYRKYENGVWSTDKFPPQLTPAPTPLEDQIADLQKKLQTTQDAVDFLLMGGM